MLYGKSNEMPVVSCFPFDSFSSPFATVCLPLCVWGIHIFATRRPKNFRILIVVIIAAAGAVAAVVVVAVGDGGCVLLFVLLLMMTTTAFAFCRAAL